MSDNPNPQRLRAGNVLRSLSLNEDRYRELKKRAVDEDKSVSEIVDELIAKYLATKPKPHRTKAT